MCCGLIEWNLGNCKTVFNQELIIFFSFLKNLKTLKIIYWGFKKIQLIMEELSGLYLELLIIVKHLPHIE